MTSGAAEDPVDADFECDSIGTLPRLLVPLGVGGDRRGDTVAITHDPHLALECEPPAAVDLRHGRPTAAIGVGDLLRTGRRDHPHEAGVVVVTEADRHDVR